MIFRKKDGKLIELKIHDFLTDSNYYQKMISIIEPPKELIEQLYYKSK